MIFGISSKFIKLCRRSRNGLWEGLKLRRQGKFIIMLCSRVNDNLFCIFIYLMILIPTISILQYLSSSYLIFFCLYSLVIYIDYYYR